ncbi:hypothetical protein DL769_005032 [Monosporascus sp. CRB-8-3]|nr:hypothetical protein DL769_005032 [Monosporascus sp. CRB-8-3]
MSSVLSPPPSALTSLPVTAPGGKSNSDLFEEPRANYVLPAGRVDGVKPEGGEDTPGAHRADVLVPAEPLPATLYLILHGEVPDALRGRARVPDHRIRVRYAVRRLVAVQVVPSPEVLVKLRLQALAAADPADVVRHVERFLILLQGRRLIFLDSRPRNHVTCGVSECIIQCSQRRLRPAVVAHPNRTSKKQKPRDSAFVSTASAFVAIMTWSRLRRPRWTAGPSAGRYAAAASASPRRRVPARKASAANAQHEGAEESCAPDRVRIVFLASGVDALDRCPPELFLPGRPHGLDNVFEQSARWDSDLPVLPAPVQY